MQMTTLNQKLNDAFPGYTVRKDLVKKVSGNAAVPTYVLEFLLGQNCATDDEEQIEQGIERVKEILARHYVQRAEAGLVRSRIRETEYQRIIDKVSVSLNEKRDCYEATFENLGISKVVISSSTVKANQRLLVSGVWCIADISYAANEARDESPYILDSLKPIQMAFFDFDEYCVAREGFTSDEWIDVVIRSIGLEPDQMGKRDKLFQLTRLINYCERNYNYIELGPKGTGKSHVFSEFSPHGILISGGEVTPAKLFVNNSTGKIGLLGYWDCVAFDEFAGKDKRPKADVVDIMKNYMANKSFSRGIEQVTAEASMAFIGNTSHDVGYMINQTDLFEDLPAIYRDSAFLDRLWAYIPGWEMDILRGDMFCEQFGFIVDYLAEALRHLRTLDYSNLYEQWFELSSSLSSRDRDGIRKTFSGLMKIVYPGKNATRDEALEILEFAMEMRKRVKDQLYRLDGTYERVDFAWREAGGAWHRVATLEEIDYPESYHSRDLVPLGDEKYEPAVEMSGVAAGVGVGADAVAASFDAAGVVEVDPADGDLAADGDAADEPAGPQQGHVAYRENQRGVSYESLLGEYLNGAGSIQIIDPYVRTFHQCRNLMEVLECALKHFDYTVPELKVHLLTGPDEYGTERQVDYLKQIADAVAPMGMTFTWDFDETRTIHARHILVDDAWDIMLDRGLDIWQKFDSGNAFAIESRVQEMRRVKQFEITYMRKG